MLEVDKNNKELENYGVWVKSGPENYSDEIPGSIESNEAEKTKNKKTSVKKSSAEKDDEIEGLNDSKSFAMLSQIAADLKNDLSSIKNELHELKKELSKYKKTEIDTTDEPSSVQEKPEEAVSGGFFSDDGDETIALTGDELDNIFNTAEITEESVVFEEGEKPDDDIDLTIPQEQPIADSAPGIEISEEEPAAEVKNESLTEPAYEENREELDFLDGKIDETSIQESEEITEEDMAETEKVLDTDIIDLNDKSSGTENYAAPQEEEIFIEEEISLDDELPEDILISEEIPSGINEEAPSDENFSLHQEEEITLDDESLSIPSDSDAALNEDITINEDISLDEDFTLGSEEEEITLESPSADLSIEENDEFVIEEDLSLDESQMAAPVPEEDFVIEEEILSADSGETPAVRGKQPVEKPSQKAASQGKPSQKSSAIEQEPFAEIEDTLPEEDISINLEDAERAEDSFNDNDFPLEDEISVDIPVETEINEVPEFQEEAPETASVDNNVENIPDNLKTEIKSVLVYLDQLLEALPDRKIEEFAKSEHFKTYKKLFEELGLM